MKLAIATIVLALVLAFAAPIVTAMLSSWSRFRDESALAILVGIGAVVYGGLVVGLLGRRWLSLLRGTAPFQPTPTLTSSADQA